ncbi:MAG: hypothetical protein J5626_08960 [Lachnospiraceae bacterium]|nr:hypothetical protein [Lachnospiraceae bacterium]
MTKNIIVTDANGDIIGTTYPKRAKGLVKNGRACFAGNDTIRMSASDVSSETLKISEEKSMIYITFKGEEWLRRDVDISYMSNVIDGSVTEALMLGSWNNGQKVAQSRIFMLTPNTEYRFVFWLNGGENESGDETCEFKVAFFSDWENANVYKLNRGFIRPLLHQKGWELYELPFKTPDVEGDVSVTFSFVACKAPMAVLPALEPSAYADLKDEPDEFEAYRPQRHNIVFKDGWPSITQYGGDKYSTEAIRKKVEAKNAAANAPQFDFGHFPFDASKWPFNPFDAQNRPGGKHERFGKGPKNPYAPPIDDEEDGDDVWEEIEELSEEVEESIDEIEGRLDDAEQMVEDAESDLENLTDEEDFDSEAFKDELESIDREFNELENEIAYITGDIDKAYKKLTAVSRHFGKGNPDKARNELSLIMAEVKKLDARVYSLESRAESVSDEVNDLADEL